MAAELEQGARSGESTRLFWVDYTAGLALFLYFPGEMKAHGLE